MAPPEKKINNLDESEGFIYESKTGLIRPIDNINRVAINLLQGIIPQKTLLLENTINFSKVYLQIMHYYGDPEVLASHH